MEFRLGSAAFIVVFATYLFLGGMGLTDRGNPEPRDAAYNLLARGLLSGHLYLDKEPPPALAQLADPYDPAANKAFRVDTVYRLHDFTYYGGRLYLYFGVAPALLVFIPWHLLTGGWLPHWAAVAFLCFAGLLVNASLVRSIRLRAFPGLPQWMTAAQALLLGLGSYAPVLLSRADMYEVPIAMSYVSVSVALRCLWEAYCSPARATRWIALASSALGVAFASRPNVIPAAAMLAFPFALGETRRDAWNWFAAAVPLAACGACVALYNYERFANPLEFGTSYMLQGVFHSGNVPSFRLSYFWTNVRLHLYQGVDWSSVFPYAHEPPEADLRPAAGGVEHVSGVFLNTPILWAALAVPAFAWARRPGRVLGLFLVTAGWATLCPMLELAFFAGANARYQFEYAPLLALLASVGVMMLEGLPAGPPRAVARAAWLLCLLFSSEFTVLYGIDRCVTDHNYFGIACLARGDFRAAEREFATARFLSPGNAFSRLESAVALASAGRPDEARVALEALVADYPGDAMARTNLARVLAGEGRLAEAVDQYRAALRLDPGNATATAGLRKALDALARQPSR